MGLFVTVEKHHGDICPCNIFPGHNSFGQENLLDLTYVWNPFLGAKAPLGLVIVSESVNNKKV